MMIVKNFEGLQKIEKTAKDFEGPQKPDMCHKN